MTPCQHLYLPAMLALCGRVAAQDCVWTRVSTPIAPSPRHDAAIAYDSARSRVVLFGGRTYPSGTPLSDTWEWNGTSWILAASSGPSARYGHAMVFHAGLGQTVLYGGSTSDTQVWTWDGTLWRAYSIGNALTGNRPTIGYDPVHNRCILLGVNNDGVTRELAADGSWVALPLALSPPTRAAGPIVYDSDRGRLIMFGSATTAALRGEVWEFNAKGNGSWLFRGLGPLNRASMAACFDPVRHRTVLQGGLILFQWPYTNSSETWEFDSSTFAWTKRADDGPGYRFGASMIFDQARSSTLLFGGLSGWSHTTTTGNNDLWIFDGSHQGAIALLDEPLSIVQASVIGQSVALSVSSSGATAFQWYKAGIPMTNGGHISGAQSPTLLIDGTSLSDAASYSLTLSGACSTITRFRYLQVEDPNCYTNCDHSTTSPVLNINDLNCFINRYAAADTYANCDGSTTPPVVNANDFNCFLNKYAGGCQ